jgi:hypothetical protein
MACFAANAATPPTWSREAEAREARSGVAHAEAAVDHQPRKSRLDDETIAFAAAPQRREAHQTIT